MSIHRFTHDKNRLRQEISNTDDVSDIKIRNCLQRDLIYYDNLVYIIYECFRWHIPSYLWLIKFRFSIIIFVELKIIFVTIAFIIIL
jgi:hypothetical protein